MKIKILLFAILLFSVRGYNQTWQWTHPEPNGLSSSSDYDLANKIVSDNKGNIYELGEYDGSLYLDGALRTSGNGSFIAKYNATGKLLWYKLINAVTAGGRITGGDIAVLNNRLFLTGTFKPSDYNEYCSIVQQPVYSIGSFNFSPVLGAMGMFYATLDLSGNVLSNLQANGLNSPSNCQPIGSIFDPPLLAVSNNNLYMAFSCNIQGTSTGYSNFNIGPYPIYSGYSHNVIVIKCDASGFILWSNAGFKIGNDQNSDAFVRSITSDKNGNVFLNCGLSDNMKFGDLIFHTTSNNNYPNQPYASSVAVKISNAGEWNFIKEIANYTYENNGKRCQNLATDENNNLYMTVNVVQNGANTRGIILGDTLPHIGTEPAMYLVKMDNSGNPLWKKYFGKNPFGSPLMGGGGYADEVVISGNNLYISGSIRGDASPSFLFDKLTVPGTICGSAGSQNLQYFVAQADINGNFKWVTSICGPTNSEARSIWVNNGNIYTCGYYRVSINNLGHLNGSFTNPNGNVSNMFLGELKDQYIRVGEISAKQVSPGCSISIPFTSSGLTFSHANHMIAELSKANGNFDSPVVIGDVKSTGTGIIKVVLPATLPMGTKGYRIRIRSTDTLLTGFNYYAYADTGYALTIACPAAPPELTVSNITGTSATLNWPAVGCAAGYKVQYRIKGTTAWTTATANSATSTLNVTGLTANTIYQWRVATRCKNNGAKSFSAFSPVKQFTTAASLSATASGSPNEYLKADKKFDAAIMPNPAQSSALLTITGSTVSATIIISDMAGKTLWQKNNVTGKNIILPLQNLANGTYMVTVREAGNIKTLKLLKQ